MPSSDADPFTDGDTVIVNLPSTSAPSSLFLDGASPAPSHNTFISQLAVPDDFSIGSPMRPATYSVGPTRHHPQSITDSRETRILQHPVPYSPDSGPQTPRPAPDKIHDHDQAHDHESRPRSIQIAAHPKPEGHSASRLVSPSSVRRKPLADQGTPSILSPLGLLDPRRWQHIVHADRGQADSASAFTRWLPFRGKELLDEEKQESRLSDGDNIGGSKPHADGVLLRSPPLEVHDREHTVLLRRANPRQSREAIRTYTHRAPLGQHERTYTWFERPLREEYVLKTPNLSAFDMVTTHQEGNMNQLDAGGHPKCICGAAGRERDQAIADPSHGPERTTFVVDNTDALVQELNPPIQEVRAGDPIPDSIAKKAKAPRRFRDNRHWFSDRSRKQKRCMLITVIILTVAISMILGFAVSDQAGYANELEMQRAAELQ